MVGGVEVSTDGGDDLAPRRPAAATLDATRGRAGVAVSYTIRSRAVDDSGNLREPRGGRDRHRRAAATRRCPCSIWGAAATPAKPAETTDTSAGRGRREVPLHDGRPHHRHPLLQGQRPTPAPTSATSGRGPGTLLATATFTNETATGWQEVTLRHARSTITADTTYVASYHAPRGNYASNVDYFARGRRRQPAAARAAPTARTAATASTRYGPSGTLPERRPTARENYWVDVVFETASGADTTPPTVTGVTPGARRDGRRDRRERHRARSARRSTATTVNDDERSCCATPAGAVVPAAVELRRRLAHRDARPDARRSPPATTYTGDRQGRQRAASRTSPATRSPADDTWTFTTARRRRSSGCPCSIWPATARAAEGGRDDRQRRGRDRHEVPRRDRRRASPGCASTRARPTPARTSATCGRAPAQLLATVTFTSETRQRLAGGRASPRRSRSRRTRPTSPPTTRRAATTRRPTSSSSSAGVDNAPLHALARRRRTAATASTATAPSGTFPNGTYRSENYWVDVVFDTNAGPDTTPADGHRRGCPARDATGVAAGRPTSAPRFNEAMTAASITTATRPAARRRRHPRARRRSPTTAPRRTATLDPTGELAEATPLHRDRQGRRERRQGPRRQRAGAPTRAGRSRPRRRPGPAPDEGPGGPILVIAKRSNPFSRYYAEILRAEGLNAFTVTDIANVTPATLAGYDVGDPRRHRR